MVRSQHLLRFGLVYLDMNSKHRGGQTAGYMYRITRLTPHVVGGGTAGLLYACGTSAQ